MPYLTGTRLFFSGGFVKVKIKTGTNNRHNRPIVVPVRGVCVIGQINPYHDERVCLPNQMLPVTDGTD